jgi:hypothetical protein
MATMNHRHCLYLIYVDGLIDPGRIVSADRQGSRMLMLPHCRAKLPGYKMDYRTMLTEIGLFLSLYSIGKVRNLG